MERTKQSAGNRVGRSAALRAGRWVVQLALVRATALICRLFRRLLEALTGASFHGAAGCTNCAVIKTSGVRSLSSLFDRRYLFSKKEGNKEEKKMHAEKPKTGGRKPKNGHIQEMKACIFMQR